MNIPDFVQSEIDYITENANFSERELQLFALRNAGYTLDQIADEMVYSISTVKRINKKMKQKILKIL